MTREEALELLESGNVDFDAEVDAAPVAPEDREKITQWVRALRSSAYPQGDAYLYTPAHKDHDYDDETPEGYCCLGVYCYEVAQVSLHKLQNNEFPRDADIDFPLTYTAQSSLAALNDGCMKNGRMIPSRTFSQIADIIEAVWE